MFVCLSVPPSKQRPSLSLSLPLLSPTSQQPIPSYPISSPFDRPTVLLLHLLFHTRCSGTEEEGEEEGKEVERKEGRNGRPSAGQCGQVSPLLSRMEALRLQQKTATRRLTKDKTTLRKAAEGPVAARAMLPVSSSFFLPSKATAATAAASEAGRHS